MSEVVPRTSPQAMFLQLRPKQWTKNGLLFAALVFSNEFLHLEKLERATLALLTFCLLSSTGYVYNDLRDAEADRLHPKKRHRPIASGAVSETAAWGLIVGCFLGGLAIAAVVGVDHDAAGAMHWSPAFLVVSLLYFATTLSYSTIFKHFVILDVMFLAACYIWRAVAGAVAINVTSSPWLLVCTAFFALFLGFNKRRGEILLLEGKHAGTRKALAHYSPEMLQEFQAITTSGSILSYALYTVLGSQKSPWLLLTLPYVLYGIFRYIYLIDQKGEGSAPDETLLRDRPILLTCFLFLLTAAAVMMWAPSHPL